MSSPKKAPDFTKPGDVAEVMQSTLAMFNPRMLFDDEQWALSHFRDIEKAWFEEIRKASESATALTTKMQAAKNPAEAMSIYVQWLQGQVQAMPATAEKFLQLWSAMLGAGVPKGFGGDAARSS